MKITYNYPAHVLKCIAGAAFIIYSHSGHAKLAFKSEVVSDLVPLSCREYSFSYAFKNTGNKDVKILEITTSCSCTKAESDKAVYAPGESGKISGIFEIGDREGRQNKNIYIRTDDPETPRMALALKLAIPILAEFRPKMLLWRKGEVPKSKKLHVDTAREYGVRVVKVECPDKNFKVDFVPQRENSDSCEISIRPISLKETSKSEISLICSSKDGSSKIYKVYILIR